MTDTQLRITNEIKLLGEFPDDNLDEYKRWYTQAIASCFGIPLTFFCSNEELELIKAVVKMAGIKDEKTEC
jgi:hypothetical protein